MQQAWNKLAFLKNVNKLKCGMLLVYYTIVCFAGADENSEPQPIPSLIVGCDKDSSYVSPYALRYWVSTSIRYKLQDTRGECKRVLSASLSNSYQS